MLLVASLEFCLACRSVSTLHVTVEIRTPRRLWATSPERPSSRRRGRTQNRLIRVRARGMTWMTSADVELMSRDNDLLANVEFV